MAASKTIVSLPPAVATLSPTITGFIVVTAPLPSDVTKKDAPLFCTPLVLGLVVACAEPT